MEIRKYLLTLVLVPGEGQSEVLEEIKEVVAGSSGKVLGEEELVGKKQAYEIKKRRDGVYYQMRIEAGTDFSPRLQPILRVSDKVLRFILLSDSKKPEPVKKGA